ncbi:ABC transporter permease [Acanthopleuribacter pedis]|uniref:ABC transporter permease n=1 Tax=Acanthopleuribacter pedis TaxID=442870 RepID=A0A8J7U2Q2_9BACT|nr:ABC transporter permease [Acanthopleuribacter pedis]MBO1318812.1 ABC transporter permease [Acanthopleuribacter pedis]
MEAKSEIYSQGYRKWEGERKQQTPPWFLIGEAGLANLFESSGKKTKFFFFSLFLFYYLGCFGITVLRLQADNLRSVPAIAPFVEAFAGLNLDYPEIWWHAYMLANPTAAFAFIAMIIYGAQLISKDKAANALQIYFSKAVTRFDYILGKFFAIGLIMALATLVPSAIMLVTGLVVTPDFMKYISQAWYVPFIITAFWLLYTVTYGSVILAFSASQTSSTRTSVLFFGFLMVVELVPLLISKLMGASDFITALSWSDSIKGIADALLAQEAADGGLLFWQSVMVTAYTVAAMVFLSRRIEPVAVVS